MAEVTHERLWSSHGYSLTILYVSAHCSSLGSIELQQAILQLVDSFGSENNFLDNYKQIISYSQRISEISLQKVKSLVYAYKLCSILLDNISIVKVVLFFGIITNAVFRSQP